MAWKHTDQKECEFIDADTEDTDQFRCKYSGSCKYQQSRSHDTYCTFYARRRSESDETIRVTANGLLYKVSQN